ncbi:tetratricopeptide repeat protein [bacterium]|nr:tetratricopeptide repeat protein [bacterium]
MIQVLLVLVLSAILVILFRRFALISGSSSPQLVSPVAEKIKKKHKLREERLKKRLQLEKALEKVRSLKRKGEIEKAEKILLKLVSLFNGRAEVFYELGLLYLENKRYRNAISALKAAINRDPENGFYFHALGLAHLRRREYRKAAENFDKALHFNNKIAYRWADLALALIGLERFKEAREAIKQALEIEPHNVRYRAILESVEKKLPKTS